MISELLRLLGWLNVLVVDEYDEVELEVPLLNPVT
jgi:hypothetical protein